MSWSDNPERLEQCRDLWNAGGMSAADIAERLGLGRGQRNAVISAARRHRTKVDPPFMQKAAKGVSKTRRSTKRKRKDPAPTAQHQNGADAALAKKARQARAASAPAVGTGQPRTNPPILKQDKAAAAPAAGVPFVETRDIHCRWPLWHAHDDSRHVCGAHAPPGSSYCPEHAKQARSDRQPAGVTKPSGRRQP